MTASAGPKNEHARRLFDGIAPSYEGPARAFSYLQYNRWHRALLSQVSLSESDSVLDVCTGTGMVASRIADSAGCRVVGVDLNRSMLDRARSPSVVLVTGRAESLPFADDSFDAVVFTFLLRYVEDPQSTLRELARVLRPGGQMASLEFYVPQGPITYPLWLLHTRLVLPLGTRLLSRGWREVGSFLGPSISAFYREHTLESLGDMWERAGVGEIQNRVLSLGGAVVTWGRKEPTGGG